ncbi:MAG TPA: M20/M25/M40 family metallo-hydrolase [Gemmatimonadales bacterium]|nr:M20/M25/M40 family metallo-hydrolase [Gemmatimonadales bacterium]
MARTFRALAVLLVAAFGARSLAAQTLSVDDPVLRAIWAQGMDSSRAYDLAQALMDSIGPRLNGSPAHHAANEWAVARLRSWGVDARNEQYGTWRSWRRGITHLDLLTPRVRTLEATMLAWSPGVRGKVNGRVVALPELADTVALAQWAARNKDAFILISYAQPTCRPDSSYREFARPDTWDRMVAERTAGRAAWADRLQKLGGAATVQRVLDRAGVKGILTNNWSQGWGVDKVFGAGTFKHPLGKAPALDVSCEDYGLLYRLAERGQGPTVRLEAEAEDLGEQPVYNTIGMIRGSTLPDEYVVLSAHYDSWDAGSGATDNGTGSTVMLEAMRILRAAYPHPKRTIMIGLWGGEEQGLNGSRAYAADHPEVVSGLQALFNQDNGTGRIENISAAGLIGPEQAWASWIARLPAEVTRDFRITFPGIPAGGGSDMASFVCYGAPSFGVGSLNWEYFLYTWHTNRDTFDKVVFDEIKNNAVLVASLAYLASEHPERLPRDRRVLPMGRNGQQMTWPECTAPARSSVESPR